MKTQPIFSDDYLSSVWATELEEYKAGGQDAAVLARLRRWDERDLTRTETEVSDSFVQQFFREFWGYWMTGGRPADEGYCMTRETRVAGAGQGGNQGYADLAIGWYGRGNVAPVDQVLCEFKDIRSCLDAPQNRKGNSRSPVKQCFDYLRYAFDQTPTNSAVRPAWGIATDMNEFRLYARRLGEGQVQRFVIRPRPGEPQESLLDEGDAGCLRRFLFSRLFHRELLLSERGPTPLEQMLDAQGLRERALEEEFYREYSAFRETLFDALVVSNPDQADTKWKLVRLAQRLLDRLLFILFAEDMGGALNFPRDLLRDILAEHSRSLAYDPDDQLLWGVVKKLFRSMADGVPFGKATIPRFNGGLFQEDPELDALQVPTRVFCVARQGETPASMLQHPRTLLYFSAKYNFGTTGAQQQRTIGLYALGRIFEQSLTDLEVLEARAAGRESLAEITKRKRDGVYYTPEWVTSYIVQQTVGLRLEEIKRESGLEGLSPPTRQNALCYIVSTDDKRRVELRRYEAWYRDMKTGQIRNAVAEVRRYLAALETYLSALARFTVVDPACGSGAFLIQALDLLLRERRWVAEERRRIDGQMLFDEDKLIRETLANNIYGVDINAESVEITKLALWLHTALPGKPLCALDDNIRCGNSLVGPEFTPWYSKKRGLLFAQVDEGVQAEVNVFDWQAAFHKVFAAGGFDAVIGNPPYVKLQHFRRVQADVAEYLVEARSDGKPLYRSTQTGNFDLYLPFIEKGISLLKPDGRMGFIAPSLWLVNEYGTPLRELVREARCLTQWVDFGDYQVFGDVTKYTAVQIFSHRASNGFAVVDASNGDVEGTRSEMVGFGGLAEEGPWHIGTGEARALLQRLRSTCTSLEDVVPGGAVGFRGIESGADEFYHFRKVAPGRYEGVKKGAWADMRGVLVTLDDGAMRPLVSSSDARRFEVPTSDVHAIFPYVVEEHRARLLSPAEMEDQFPATWAYLRGQEHTLRQRENGRMDRDCGWWGYNYPKNLDRQDKPKLGVPQTVQRLAAFYDSHGQFAFNNVRVGGIAVESDAQGWFLLGVLNSPTLDWCFRQVARKKANGYFEANQQFIAPLPVPHATDEQKAAVGECARRLQELHTHRRDLAVALEQRISSEQCKPMGWTESWFWSSIEDEKHWRKNSPKELRGREATAWARKHYHTLLGEKLAEVGVGLQPGCVLAVQENLGEIAVRSHVHRLVRCYPEAAIASFVAAQWRHALRHIHVSETFDAKALVRLLLNVRRTDNIGLRDQVVKLDQEILQLDAEIARAEDELNEIIYGLYALTEDERLMVEEG